MLASDPVGATWGTGVRRAPSTTTWGWNAAMIGEHEDSDDDGRRACTTSRCRPIGCGQRSTTWARSDKVLVDLACSSHNAMWEKNHLLMFGASLEWLSKGAVGEQKTGVIRLGY